MLNIKYLIIFIVIIFISYKYCKNTEKFFSLDESNTKIEDLIEEKIKKFYGADIDAMRNLGVISEKLASKDGYILPGNITIDGSLKLGGNLKLDGSFNYLPKGTIVAFNSKVIPDGWAICDGTKGTPDLRDRFILGYNNNSKSVKTPTKEIGYSGGKNFIKIDKSNMPKHNHGAAGVHSHKTIRNFEYEGKCFGQGNNAFSWGGGAARIGTGEPCFRTSNDGNHTHNDEGESKPFNIMPPYVILMYIIKL